MENKFEINFQKLLYNFNNFENIKYQDKVIDKGYIINLKDYEIIKKKIKNYENDKNINENNFFDFNIKQIEYKSLNYLMNMILNGNEYIIIIEDLWKIISDKNVQKYEKSIEFIINSNKVTLYLNNKSLEFSYSFEQKIILNESLLLNKDNLDYSNYNIIMNFYNNIVSYYNFEKQFLIELKRSFDSNYKQEECFIINKVWFDNWIKYSYYEYFKNLLSKNPINKQEIKNKIIYYLEKDNYIYKELKLEDKDIINVNKKLDLESYLEDNSLVIIDQLFLASFQKNLTNSIKYILYDNKIKFYINNEILDLNLYNNIIFTKNIYININQILYYSINLYNEYSKISQRNISANNYLINRNYMISFESILNYEKVKTVINEYKINNQFNCIFKKDDEDYNNYIINKVKELLKDKIYKLDIFKKDEMNKLLNIDSISKIVKKEYKSNGVIIFSYEDCQLINKEILKIIKKIDGNNNINKKILDCNFIDNKVIYSDDKNIMNIFF